MEGITNEEFFKHWEIMREIIITKFRRNRFENYMKQADIVDNMGDDEFKTMLSSIYLKNYPRVWLKYLVCFCRVKETGHPYAANATAKAIGCNRSVISDSVRRLCSNVQSYINLNLSA